MALHPRGTRTPIHTALVTLASVTCLALGSTACGSGATPTPSATPTPVTSPATPGAVTPTTAGATTASPPATTPTPAVPVVTIVVRGRDVTVTPAKVRVAKGGRIALTVTSDVTNELHVHGLEIERELSAGTPTTLDLTFPDPGVFELELHDPTISLTEVTVGSVGG